MGLVMGGVHAARSAWVDPQRPCCHAPHSLSMLGCAAMRAARRLSKYGHTLHVRHKQDAQEAVQQDTATDRISQEKEEKDHLSLRKSDDESDKMLCTAISSPNDDSESVSLPLARISLLEEKLSSSDENSPPFVECRQPCFDRGPSCAARQASCRSDPVADELEQDSQSPGWLSERSFPHGGTPLFQKFVSRFGAPHSLAAAYASFGMMQHAHWKAVPPCMTSANHLPRANGPEIDQTGVRLAPQQGGQSEYSEPSTYKSGHAWMSHLLPSPGNGVD
ncbi:hypothetical protein Micbo1qcDRAFT_175474 [Microdochium bolleyi]|uniref:Uncharacterized protein n=1 Tax=Microdochium bolleyi TaxID=196109 RepID=A0A136J2D2_9PEZI|nr:hypothetical protein Micbo1qcDRAFT_175474 [Microdochium bolleyi]